MDPRSEVLRGGTRRWFLSECAVGLGGMALSGVLPRLARAAENPLAPRPPHFAPRAKRVIYLFMAGAPSQLDLFDPKRKLVEISGQPVPDELIRGERFAFIKGHPKALGSPYEFRKHGEAGHDFSELLPHMASVADEWAVVRSVRTDQFNHAPAQIHLNTGHFRIGRPSMGSWLSYGLGTEGADLPSFVVLLSGPYMPDGGASCWSSGFLPTVHQGVRFRSQGEAVLHLADPPGMDRPSRRRALDALADLNRKALARYGDPEIETRIAQYEMAYRMQSSVPELLSIDAEPAAIREAYGVEPGKASFANNALLARRLVERGVRFVQLYHWGWDTHGSNMGDDIVHTLPQVCREVDRATGALVRDLKEKGLLEDTLVVWGGEFGRTPMNEERDGSKFLGRDHHPHAFTVLFAGGGTKAGAAIGATDELGCRVVEDPVSVHDLQATILHLLGLDHTRLTYRFQGRDYRLTDVAGEVVRMLLA